MRNSRGTLFTMRRDGRPSSGDWFRIENKGKSDVTKVYIYDEIGFWGTEASDFVHALNEVDSPEIHLHVNSPGGEIFDGLAIYHALVDHESKVTAYVDALAASAASFIIQGADEVVMMRNSQMMIHDGSGMCMGNADDMRQTADTLDRLSDNIADIYSQSAGSNVEYWRSLMREETWFSANEAVTYGLADKVDSKEDTEAEEDATNKWDLKTLYNHEGRQFAESPTRVRERILVSNTTKENLMARGPKDTTSQPEEPTPGGTTPPLSEGTPAAPDDEAEVVEDENGNSSDTASAPESPPEAAPSTPTETEPSQVAASLGATQGVLINGHVVTDWQAIQNHISSQAGALRETANIARKDRIKELATAGKILAPNMTETETFVLGLTDEQYKGWSALYDSAPSMPVTGQHGQTRSDEGAPLATPEAATADRITVLRGILDTLGRSMSDDKIKQTDSYKELHTLLGTSDKE